MAWDSRPYVMPYEEGQPIPPGYEIDTTVRKGLVIPGSVIMGGMWLSSLVHGVLMQSDCEDSPCGSESDTFVALMVPVGGPFAAASMTEIGSLRAAALISGTLQAAGLAMFVVGVSARDKRLKRVADRGVEVELVASPTGAMLRGAF